MRIAVLFLLGTLLISAASVAQVQPETRIMNAFMRLGMDRIKAHCYGQIIGQTLDPQDKGTAVSIVEAAQDSQAVQQGVMNSGMPVMNAFSAANQTCGS